MKNKILIFLITFIIMLGFVSANAMGDEISIQLNGETVEFHTNPIIQNSRTLVSVEPFLEKMGAKLNYNSTRRIVEIDGENVSIILLVNYNFGIVYSKNDFSGMFKRVYLDVSTRFIDDECFVPLRFVAEALGAKVSWDDVNRQIVIQTKDFVKDSEIVLGDPLNYTVIDSSKVIPNERIKAWIDSYKRIQGVHYLKDDNSIYALIAGGECRTSGYSMEVNSVNMLSSDTAYVRAKLISPQLDMINLQVITYPYEVIVISEESIDKVDGYINNLNNSLER